MKKIFSLLFSALSLISLFSFAFSTAQATSHSNQSEAQDISGRWRQIAPGMAGSNRALYADSKDPNKLWATPDMGNDYITLDAGKHWETVIPVDGIWTQRMTLSDECVISDPKDNNIVLSLNKSTIYYSTDGGFNFNKITSFSSGTAPGSPWYIAAAHPTENDTWYLANGLDNKYYRSGVNPNTLTGIYQNKSKVWKITDITKSSRTIEAIPNTGMENATAVFDLFCHPDATNYPDMLFAATSSGVYRKDNANTDWVKISEGCSKADLNWDGTTLTLYVLKQLNYTVNNNTLTSEGGVFKTIQAETATSATGWTDMSNTLNIDLTQLSIKRSWFEYFVKGWFGYTNGEEDDINTPSSFIQEYSDILCDPTDANKVYLSIWGGTISRPTVSAIWSTKDGGTNWLPSLRLGTGYAEDASYWNTRQRGINNRNTELGVAKKKLPDFVTYEERGVRSMAMAADGTLYASAVKGYHTYKYSAADDYWTSVDNTQVGDIFYGHGNNDTGAFGVIPDKHKPGEMFLLQYEASAYKSTADRHPDFPGVPGVYPIPALIDIGQTWAPGQPLNTPVTAASHPSDESIFYIMSARTGEIAKISGNGETYTTMGEPIEVPNTLNVSEMKCIYWTDLTIASDGKTMYAIAEIIDTDNKPMGQTKIFNPEPDKGVYYSTDEGVTWRTNNNGLPLTAGGRNISGTIIGDNSACLKTLTMDPNDEEVLYAAAKRYYAPSGTSGYVNGGLYYLANGARSWSKINIPTSIKSLWDIKIQKVNGAAKKIYISGGGEGSLADWGEGGLWVADYKADANYSSSDWTKIFDHPFVSHIAVNEENEGDIIVATRESSSNGKVDAGTFYTLNGGTDWTKFNTGRGGMRIGDLSFDSGNSNQVWCACESSGVYTAFLQYETTALKEASSQNTFQVYPNPISNGELNIKSQNFGEYKIYDCQGRAVKSGHFDNSSISINDLRAGFYFINLNSKTASFIVK